MSETQVRPRLPLPAPQGYVAPGTPNRNLAAPTINTAANAVSRALKDAQQPYARRDEDNDFNGNQQQNALMVDDRVRYAIVTVSGQDLDIDNYGYFILRSVGGSDFTVNLPTPTIRYDAVTGDPIREARAWVVDVEYTGTGKPIFTGALLPGNTDPAWSSTSGMLDTIVLTWADRWLLHVSDLGYVT